MKHKEGSSSKTSLYITADSNTSGTVSVPGESWSQNFTVTANSAIATNDVRVLITKVA